MSTGSINPVAVIVGILLVGVATTNVPPLFRDAMGRTLTEEECEADPKCEVVTVYGTRIGHREFDYYYNGTLHQGTFEPLDESLDPDVEEVDDDEGDWSCEPLLAEFDALLEACETRAEVAYASCLSKYNSLVEQLIGEVGLGHCIGIERRAKQHCREQDARRRAFLPPQCEVDQ